MDRIFLVGGLLEVGVCCGDIDLLGGTVGVVSMLGVPLDVIIRKKMVGLF